MSRLLASVLADGRRRWTALVALALLLGLGSRYASRAVGQHGWRWCLREPAACDGTVLSFPLWRVVAVRPDGYDLYKSYGPVPVQGDPLDLRPGATVSVAARFEADGPRLVERTREVHRRRWAKRVLGLVGLALLVAMLVAGIERTPRGWSVRG